MHALHLAEKTQQNFKTMEEPQRAAAWVDIKFSRNDQRKLKWWASLFLFHTSHHVSISYVPYPGHLTHKIIMSIKQLSRLINVDSHIRPLTAISTLTTPTSRGGMHITTSKICDSMNGVSKMWCQGGFWSSLVIRFSTSASVVVMFHQSKRFYNRIVLVQRPISI